MSQLGAVQAQNPYLNILVSASAGSGKTFQLSRRFLALVTAGAQPSSILTITFSRKAAAEMRARVIADAIAYGRGEPAFEGFYENLKIWRSEAGSRREGFTPPPLLTPDEVSHLIVQNTQSLAITTIDSVLMEWCLKFPEETKQVLDSVTLMQPWEIASRSEQLRQQNDAWQRAVVGLAQSLPEAERSNFYRTLMEAAPGSSLRATWARLQPLIASDTFIWLAEHTRGDAALSYEVAPGDLPESEEALVALLKDELTAIINLVSNGEKKARAYDAISACDFSGLTKAAIFKKDGSLHGTTVSKKIRSELPQAVSRVEDISSRFYAREQLRTLNAHSKLLWLLHRAWSREYLAVRSAEGSGTFADTLKGVFSLFHGENPGARWLLQQSAKHLLLDEFQDTSRLQWSAFRELAKDIMSGRTGDDDGLKGSVFIVGDAKQSIYGFREAAPEIVGVAEDDLKPFGLQRVELTASWRTANVVLDVVNQVFSGSAVTSSPLIAGFPVHRTAQSAAGLALPDHGSVYVLPLCVTQKPDEAQEECHIVQEAKAVASHIGRCISGTIRCDIWDKTQNRLRGAEARDFAILYPTSTHAQVLEEQLRQLGIAAIREEKRGFFERQEIRDALLFLKWMALPADSVSLCGLLRSPFCGVEDRRLQEILQTVPTDDVPTVSCSAILVELAKSHRSVSQRLTSYRDSYFSASAFVTFENWLRDTNACAVYEAAFGPLEGKLASANLLKLLEMLRHAESQSVCCLADVLAYVSDLSQDDETGNAAVGANAVRLMTVHKSKGLEYPVVVLVDTAADWYRPESLWLRKATVGEEGFCYIATKEERPQGDPQIKAAMLEHEETQRAEKARLLYVAMTRAKQHLVVSGRFSPTSSLQTPKSDCYYSLVSAAVAAAGGSVCELDGGLRLERLCREALAASACEAKTEMFAAGARENVATSFRAVQGINPTTPLKILTVTGSIHGHAQSEMPLLTPHQAEAAGIEGLYTSNVYGTAVHRCLEYRVSNRALSATALRAYLRSAVSEARRLSSSDLEKVCARAEVDAAAVTESPAWQSLFLNNLQVLTEPSLASVNGADDGRGRVALEFMTAQPDLVIEKESGEWWIVDYKTTANALGYELKELAHTLGYAEQVYRYRTALSRLERGAHIRCFILFTRNCQLVEI